MKKTIMATTLISIFSFNAVAENEVKTKTLTPSEVQEIAVSFEDYIEKGLQLPENFDLLSYSIKNNIITYSVKDDLKDEIFSFTLNLSKEKDKTYNYNGNFFPNLNDVDPFIKDFVSNLNNFPYSGKIEKINDNYNIDFLMVNEKELKDSYIFNTNKTKEDFKEKNRKVDYSIGKYLLNLKVDNANLDSFINLNFDGINIKEQENELVFKNLTAQGDSLNSEFKLEKLYFSGQNGFKINNIHNNSKVYSFKENQKRMSNTFNVKNIEFKNPMFGNTDDVITDFNFTVNFDFSNKVSDKELREVIFNKNLVRTEEILNKMLSEKFLLDVGASFNHKNFKNSVNAKFYTDGIDLDLIKQSGATDKEMIKTGIKNPLFIFKAELSPVFASFAMMIPVSFKEYIVSNEDGSISILYSTKDFKEFGL